MLVRRSELRNRGPRRNLLAIAVCLTCLASTAPAQPTRPPADVPPARQEADREQLRRLMIEHRVEAGRQRPGLALYLSDAGLAFSRSIGRLARSFLPGFAHLAGPWIGPATQLLSALAILVLVGLWLRRALKRWRGHPAQPVPEPVRNLPEETPAATAAEWDSKLRRHLEGGDVHQAALALWWWLASRLVGDRAEASWTSHELVEKAGRRDLLPGIRRLDRMLYGAAPPPAREVERLWGELREEAG